jgi:excinuclease ABC subunit A
LPWGEIAKKKSWSTQIATQLAARFNISLDTPWPDLPEEVRHLILHGNPDIKFSYQSENFHGNWPYEGVVNSTRRRFKETQSQGMRDHYSRFLSQQPCAACNGHRLRPEALSVTVGGLKISQVTALSVAEAYAWICSLMGEQTDQAGLGGQQLEIAVELLKEIRDRIKFMLDVGLHYLTLNRSAPSLSGGEGQRIRLASQIGSGLVGVMYILDEPSIGLHQRDNRRLLDSLLHLRDLGNTVLVVEHDEETMASADWIIDFGPGAGVKGGKIVFAGTPQNIVQDARSLTGKYLSGLMTVVSGNGRRKPNCCWLELQGVTHHNLKNVDARFPLGCFTSITGVSGSGKSSLITETLYPALARTLHHAQARPGPHQTLTGLEHVDKVIHITQDPIGRTPRSNPATYVKVWDSIRQLFAGTPEARARGYKPGRFSFNVKGGRCEACSGYGQKVVEMHFLPDVWVTCDVCKGKRFNRETLQIRYKGKNIAEVLDMDIAEALDFFENIPRVKRILTTLRDVGLDYVKLGQSATTLSGGEAQRVKLAKELSRVSTGDTVYILDEPTTGLHFADIQKLLDVLHRLTDAGNTVIVIEHNLDVIKSADWVIDLGPEGGDGGGQVIASGTPETVAAIEASYTGQFLKQALG